MKPTWINFKKIGDHRGALIALEENVNIPFEVKRVYYIFDTVAGVRRGFHAHKKLQQVAVCISGSCKFLLDDGDSKCETSLNDRTKGLCIGKMIWHEMFDFSSDCVLMVLASDFYDESDYIRDYEEFIHSPEF
jgi:dTDP-4-dehydrorhamnose 3,5-epimerase-like enzyme